MNLYEIDKNIKNLLQWDFEDLEEAQKQFENLEIEKEIKIDNTIKWIRQIESEYSIIDNEIERLNKLKEDKKKRVENSKSLLQYVLNNENYETPLFKIWFRKSYKIVTTENFNNPEYIKIKTVESIDKIKLKKDLKAWLTIDWAWIETNLNIYIH